MERGWCFPAVFGFFIAWSCWSSFCQYLTYWLNMKQILMTLMASCPFSVRWDQCWGHNEDGARVPCPYPLGAPHILGIARVAEVTNIHPSTDIHIYACANKCTHVFAGVINTTHVCYACMSAWVWYTHRCVYMYIYLYAVICVKMYLLQITQFPDIYIYISPV